QIDTDKDGFASMEELAAVYQGLTPGDFETMDANKDNRLDENELLSADAQAVLNRYSVTQEGASVVDVAALDADKDGFVSQEELLAVYPGVTPGEFEDMDQNGDNRLDSDELYGEAARTVLKQSGSSGPGQELTDVAALD